MPASALGSRPASEPRTTPAASESVPEPTGRPPHAGRSRSGPFCGTCGGHRGPHTVHHDQAAHERARRRYDGLHAKADSTGFPEEADACRAKAEQLRAKYGL